MLLIACDEINKVIDPPSDGYLVDKSVYTSVNEQVIESGNDFKMIFPPQSLSGDIEIKVKKESSYPVFNISNTTLGNNIYRIKFQGNTTFLIPVKIIINYDKSKIPSGKTAAESVKGYIYANGNWKLGDFQLDEVNSKIIFSISNLATPKSGKDIPVLQNEGELIFGNSILDQGQNDSKVLETLQKTLTFGQMLISAHSSVEYIEKENGVQIKSETKLNTLIPAMLTYMFNNSDNYKMSWNGNAFNININRDYEDPKYEGVKFNDKYNVTGVVSADGKSFDLSWTTIETENKTEFYGTTTVTTVRETKESFGFTNLPLGSWTKDESVTYELTGKAVKNLINKYSYSYSYIRIESSPTYYLKEEELSNFISFDIKDDTRLYITFYCK
jgi:hypothetical protein